MIATPTLPSLSNVPSGISPSINVPSVPGVKGPKLPTVPTTINIKSGKGVPGGFTGASNKKASQEVSKLSAAASSIGAQISKVSGLITGPLSAAVLAPIKSRLITQQSAFSKKAADAKKSAYDYSQATAVPKLPSSPSISVPQVSIPQLPNATSVPVVSSLPSAPVIPKIV